MNINLISDAGRNWTWIAQLRKRLEAEGHSCAVVPLPTQRFPAALTTLLELERMVYRLPEPLLEPEAAPAGEISQHEKADLTINLTGEALPTAGRQWGVEYDGQAGDIAAFAALIDGPPPVVTLKELSTRETIAKARPAANNLATISEGYQCVAVRLADLIVAGIGGHRLSISHNAGRPAATPPGAARLAGIGIKRLATAAIRRTYRLCCHAPHWRVLWRQQHGDGGFAAFDLDPQSWTALPDPGFHFYADPFPARHQGRRFVFFEDFNHFAGKGAVSAIEFDASGPTGSVFPVLEESWHLSYPFVFEMDGQHWMIPESCANKTVTLYRAERFPDRWVKEADLLTGKEYSDATIVRHAGRLWMFATVRRKGQGSWSDALHVFWSDTLLGPWQQVSQDAVLIDATTARPAGAMVHQAGQLWRPVQDCTAGYGRGIGLCRVTRLDTDGFEQSLERLIAPPAGWPGSRLHTLNSLDGLDVIDGSAYSVKSPGALFKGARAGTRQTAKPASFETGGISQ